MLPASTTDRSSRRARSRGVSGTLDECLAREKPRGRPGLLRAGRAGPLSDSVPAAAGWGRYPRPACSGRHRGATTRSTPLRLAMVSSDPNWGGAEGEREKGKAPTCKTVLPVLASDADAARQSAGDLRRCKAGEGAAFGGYGPECEKGEQRQGQQQPEVVGVGEAHGSRVRGAGETGYWPGRTRAASALLRSGESGRSVRKNRDGPRWSPGWSRARRSPRTPASASHGCGRGNTGRRSSRRSA